MLDTIKALTEVFALVAAGAYFIYRLVSGYFIVNLTVSLAVTRQPIPYLPQDYLSVTASLSKGDRGTLELHDARVRITSPHGEQVHSLLGIDRRSVSIQPIEMQKRYVINFKRRRSDRPLLRLTPDEQTSFACICQVPSDAACAIELAVLGRKVGSFWLGQWRASTISLPLSAKEAAFALAKRENT